MLDAYDHEGWCMIIFSCIDRYVMLPSCVALSMFITPTPRWLGYTWCVWSWRLMHDNLFVYWSMCDVTILRSSFHVDNSNAKMFGLCLGLWSWRLMHDNLFVYWSVCDVTIFCSSFHVDNSNAKMVGLCLIVWSWRLMHDNVFVYWSVCDVAILRSSFHAHKSKGKMFGLCLMRIIMKVDAW